MVEEVLNQDEVDALLNGVDSGALETGQEAPSGEARSFDLVAQARIVRGRMPALELINERFARLLRSSLNLMIRRTPDVAVAPIKTQKFGDYLQGLRVPTSVNLVRMAPWPGTALLALDPGLVSVLIDNYFGGVGRQSRYEGREFSPTEQQIIRSLLDRSFAHLAEAWAPVAELRPEFVASESNPQFVSCASPTEIVVVSSFYIELDGGGGDLHVTIPYSMLEPIRGQLDAGMQGERPPADGRWEQQLATQVEEAEVELTTVLGRVTSTFGELSRLQPGMVLPCDFNGTVTACVEGVPVARGALCVHRGQHAIQVQERVRRRSAGAQTSLKEAGR